MDILHSDLLCQIREKQQMIDTRLARKHENVRNMKSLFKYDLYKYGLLEYT